MEFSSVRVGDDERAAAIEQINEEHVTVESSRANSGPRREPKALLPVETELVLLLSMFPETTEQLENMLEAEQRQTLADVGRSTQEGLLESLQRLANIGVVTADQADAGPRTVWSLSEAGHIIAAEIKDRQ